MKGREKPKTRKVVMPMATGTLRVGPEGKGTDCVFIKRNKVVGSKISKTALADGNTFVLGGMELQDLRDCREQPQKRKWKTAPQMKACTSVEAQDKRDKVESQFPCNTASKSRLILARRRMQRTTPWHLLGVCQSKGLCEMEVGGAKGRGHSRSRGCFRRGGCVGEEAPAAGGKRCGQSARSGGRG